MQIEFKRSNVIDLAWAVLCKKGLIDIDGQVLFQVFQAAFDEQIGEVVSWVGHEKGFVAIKFVF